MTVVYTVHVCCRLLHSSMLESQVQLYRSSTLCDLLMEALEELCDEERMTQELAHKVLDGFDHSCLDALQNRAEAKSTLQVCPVQRAAVFRIEPLCQNT